MFIEVFCSVFLIFSDMLGNNTGEMVTCEINMKIYLMMLCYEESLSNFGKLFYKKTYMKRWNMSFCLEGQDNL